MSHIDYEDLKTKRSHAATGLRLLADCWSGSGRATVRIVEIRAVAKAMEDGEWDDFLKGNVRFGNPYK